MVSHFSFVCMQERVCLLVLWQAGLPQAVLGESGRDGGGWDPHWSQQRSDTGEMHSSIVLVVAFSMASELYSWRENCSMWSNQTLQHSGRCKFGLHRCDHCRALTLLYNNCTETDLTGWLWCAVWVPTLVEIIIAHSSAYAGWNYYCTL